MQNKILFGVANPMIGPICQVFLVEDSIVLSERLIELLGAMPDVNLVAAVDTENAAVDYLRRLPADVVLLDLHLKQGTGFGVLRAIAKMRTRPQIIVLTNYDLPEYMQASMSLGASYFLDKACDLARLPLIIREILEQNLWRLNVGLCGLTRAPTQPELPIIRDSPHAANRKVMTKLGRLRLKR
ncbi:MAG TPA: response regulator [Steroidobacteraceae bacterium]